MGKIFGLLSDVVRMVLFLIVIFFLSGALSAGFVFLFGWIFSFGFWWCFLLLLFGGIPLAFGLFSFIAKLTIWLSLFLSPYRWYSYLVIYSAVIFQNIYSIHYAWSLKDDYNWLEILLAFVVTFVVIWINNIFIICLRHYYGMLERYDS